MIKKFLESFLKIANGNKYLTRLCALNLGEGNFKMVHEIGTTSKDKINAFGGKNTRNFGALYTHLLSTKYKQQISTYLVIVQII